MSEDKIKALLERYAEQEAAEHLELFGKCHKPENPKANAFCCAYCGRKKMVSSVGMILEGLDGVKLYFCTSKCWAHWLKAHPQVCYEYAGKYTRSARRTAVETRS